MGTLIDGLYMTSSLIAGTFDVALMPRKIYPSVEAKYTLEVMVNEAQQNFNIFVCVE